MIITWTIDVPILPSSILCDFTNIGDKLCDYFGAICRRFRRKCSLNVTQNHKLNNQNKYTERCKKVKLGTAQYVTFETNSDGIESVNPIKGNESCTVSKKEENLK